MSNNELREGETGSGQLEPSGSPARSRQYAARVCCVLLLLSIALAARAPADGMTTVPDDYPSHRMIGECSLQSVRKMLQDYDVTRLEVSTVLRHLADEQPMSATARSRLLGFAANLEAMRARLPEPDPDSAAYRNFDFRLGLTFTSIALFLNDEDESLVQRFFADRDDPDSELGKYLVRLDLSRQQYLDGLRVAKATKCAGSAPPPPRSEDRS